MLPVDTVLKFDRDRKRLEKPHNGLDRKKKNRGRRNQFICIKLNKIFGEQNVLG